MGLFEKKKMNLLLKKINAEMERKKNNGEYSLFNTKFAEESISLAKDYKGLLNAYNVIHQADELGNIDYEVGVALDNAANENEVFIHRTNLNLGDTSNGINYNEDLYSIMTNGLKNSGHVNTGLGVFLTNDIPDLVNTASHLRGLASYRNLFSNWKGNDSIIVMSFPKDIIDEDGYPKNGFESIYDLSNPSAPYVKPEFVKGAFIKGPNKKWDFHSKEDILNEMSENKTL